MSEVCETGLMILISPQPPPAFSDLTVSPVTARSPALVKWTVCTGPGLPEYTHWYLTVPGAAADSVPL